MQKIPKTTETATYQATEATIDDGNTTLIVRYLKIEAKYIIVKPCSLVPNQLHGSTLLFFCKMLMVLSDHTADDQTAVLYGQH